MPSTIFHRIPGKHAVPSGKSTYIAMELDIFIHLLVWSIIDLNGPSTTIAILPCQFTEEWWNKKWENSSHGKIHDENVRSPTDTMCFFSQKSHHSRDFQHPKCIPSVPLLQQVPSLVDQGLKTGLPPWSQALTSLGSRPIHGSPWWNGYINGLKDVKGKSKLEAIDVPMKIMVLSCRKSLKPMNFGYMNHDSDIGSVNIEFLHGEIHGI